MSEEIEDYTPEPRPDIELVAKFMGYRIENRKFQYEHEHSSGESCWEWDEGEIVVDENGYEVPDQRNEPYFSLEYLPLDEWHMLMPAVNKCKSQGTTGSLKEINDILASEYIDQKKLFDAVHTFVKNIK